MFSSDASAPATLEYRTTLTQTSPGVPGKAESDDSFGISLSLRDGRAAIGSEEGIGKARSTGSVQPILWDEATSTHSAYRSIQQGTRGVPGTNKINDIFGYKVVVTRGLTAAGSYDIAIAAQEILGKPEYAGSVVVASKAIYRGYTHRTMGVPGTVGSYDWFGGEATNGRPLHSSNQTQGQTGTSGDGTPGRWQELGGDLAGDDRKAPLVKGDQLGEQFVTQTPPLARGPVNP